MMAALLVEPVANDARQRFVDALKSELAQDGFNPYLGLGVDYHPDSTLALAAIQAEVSMNNFPWKTRMRFDEDGTVEASCGYGQPVEEI